MQLKRLTQSIFNYLTHQPWHWYLAVLITLAAGFLRLYNIPNTVMFLGDQGRDALIVARIFKEKNPVFIGPVTSVGNMYLGPFYYYFMLPFLWLSYPSPLGPVYAVAILNTAAVFLLYHVGKKMFSPTVGLLSSFFLGFSSAAIDLSRFSWNPNLAPVFSLLMIFFTWKAIKKPKFWLLTAVCFSLLIQLHYFTLLAGISAGVVWLYSLIKNIKLKNSLKNSQQLKAALLSLLIFIASFTPLILFDIKHQGININAFKQILFEEKTFTPKEGSSFIQKSAEVIKNTSGRARTLLFDLNLGKNKQLNQVLLLFAALFLLVMVWQNLKNKKLSEALLVLLSFLVVGILGAAAYQHSIYNHYVAYLFPVTALVLAVILSKLIRTKWLAPVSLIFIALFLRYNLTNLPLKSNYLYKKTQAAAEIVYDLIQPNESYDIVLLSETRDLYGQSYRYFLSTTDKKPIYKDRAMTRVPEALVIIDEEKKAEDVTSLPIYEIMIHAGKEVDEKIKNQDLPDIYIIR
jgi:4-amino-4-deoxy-L-arabinose transferase-like glycosyltransferase